MNEFIRLTEQSVKQEHRGTITACTYRCPGQQLYKFTKLKALEYIKPTKTCTLNINVEKKKRIKNVGWRKSENERSKKYTTNRQIRRVQNPSLFDHVNLTNAYIMLNSTRYPMVDYNASFQRHKFAKLYGDVASFRSKFYNMNELVSNPKIKQLDYKISVPDIRLQRKKAKRKTENTSDRYSS